MAQKVLQRSRRPMTPRDILRQAYRDEVVPARLYGATQHKTLQARLSEEILHFRERSLFFRTAPGRFFLREFLDDKSIAEDFRKPIVARRRARELRRKDVLTLPADKRGDGQVVFEPVEHGRLFTAIEQGSFAYTTDIAHRRADEMVVWSFVVVQRKSEILTYRQGRYREDRDSFLQRRCAGFYAPVARSDVGLFDQNDLGLVASGLRILAMDLNLIGGSAWSEMAEYARLVGFVVAQTPTGARDLLGIVRIDCPDWFEPATQRLAINELMWHDLHAPVNHINDFDPWSQEVLQQARQWAEDPKFLNEASYSRNY